LLNGTRRLGALAVAAAIFASACTSTGATATPAATPAPATAVAAATSAPASAPTAAAAATFSCVTGSITAAGSTALQPLVAAAAKQYDAACSGATITVNPGGSGTGLSQVASGAVQIGNSDVTAQSKLATPMPADSLVDHIVARQGWIVVTNKGVTGVTNLTTQQQVDIWTGKDTNWNQVGGPDMPIVLIFRPSSSGTRSTFKKLVLGGKTEAIGGQTLTEDSNGAVTTAITKTNGAVSVIGFAYYNDPVNKPNLNGLQLDGVDATVANMSSGTYKLAADGHMYTLGTPATGSLTEAFLAYMMGPDIQGTLIPSLSYAPVAK
jgi:phosphate transport system substrate-binding protein